MTTDDLFDAIGNIDDDLIDFAENYDFKKRKRFNSTKYLLTAAAILLVVATGPKLLRVLDLMFAGGSSTDSSQPEATLQLPETGMPQTESFLLFELSGSGKTRIVCHYPPGIVLRPIGLAEISPGEFEIDSEGEWNLKLLFSSGTAPDPAEITFDFLSSETGEPVEVMVKMRFISADEAENLDM